MAELGRSLLAKFSKPKIDQIKEILEESRNNVTSFRKQRHKLESEQKSLLERFEGLKRGREGLRQKKHSLRTSAQEAANKKQHQEAIDLYKEALSLPEQADEFCKQVKSLLEDAETQLKTARKLSDKLPELGQKAEQFESDAENLIQQEEAAIEKLKEEAESLKKDKEEKDKKATEIEVEVEKLKEEQARSKKLSVEEKQSLEENIRQLKTDSTQQRQKGADIGKKIKGKEIDAYNKSVDIKRLKKEVEEQVRLQLQEASSKSLAIVIDALQNLVKEAVSLGEDPLNETSRERAVLLAGLAEAHLEKGEREDAHRAANESKNEDAIYCQPYLILGKLLSLSTSVRHEKVQEACDTLCSGLLSEEVEVPTSVEDQAAFLIEILSLLDKLEENTQQVVVEKIEKPLKHCWTRIVTSLCRRGQWGVLRTLILGPPFSVANTEQVQDTDWTWFADRCNKGEGQIQVGVAMGYKVETVKNPPCMTPLVDYVRSLKGSREWATDLVLAMLLQGAQLKTLLQSDTETCYHVALSLCCATGKLGLLRHLLFEEQYRSEAVLAVSKNGQTLLHVACIKAGNEVNRFEKEVVSLLLENRVDPTVVDGNQKRALHYLNPKSPAKKHLKAKTDEEEHRKRKAAERAQKKKCPKCQNLLSDAKIRLPKQASTKAHQSAKDMDKVASYFRDLERVLNCPHEAFEEMKPELSEDALNDVAERLHDNWISKPDIVTHIMRFPQENLRNLIEKLRKAKRWSVVRTLLEKIRDSGTEINNLTDGLLMVELLKDEEFEQKTEMVQSMLRVGCRLPALSDLDTTAASPAVKPDALREVLQRLVDRQEAEIVLTLLEKDRQRFLDGLALGNREFSLEHYAFRIGLHKTPGNFQLFKKLMEKTRTVLDANGNTYLHLAIQAESPEVSVSAVEMLETLGLIVDNWNVDGKMAVDYFRNSSDKRINILIEFFVVKMRPLSEQEVEKAKEKQNSWFLKRGEKEQTRKEQARERERENEPPEQNEQRDDNMQDDGNPLTVENMDELPWKVVVDKTANSKLHSKDLSKNNRKQVYDMIARLATGLREKTDTRRVSIIIDI